MYCIVFRAILNDAHNHKYHHHHCQISYKSVTVVTRQHDQSCAFLKSEWRPIISGAIRSFFMLLVQFVLWHHFGLFHPASVSLLPPAKLSDNHPVGKLWKHERINITGLNEWCRHTKKHWLGIALVCANGSPFLNSVPFFKNASKFQSMHFQQQNILDFILIFIGTLSFYIFQRLYR